MPNRLYKPESWEMMVAQPRSMATEGDAVCAVWELPRHWQLCTPACVNVNRWQQRDTCYYSGTENTRLLGRSVINYQRQQVNKQHKIWDHKKPELCKIKNNKKTPTNRSSICFLKDIIGNQYFRPRLSAWTLQLSLVCQVDGEIQQVSHRLFSTALHWGKKGMNFKVYKTWSSLCTKEGAL